MKPGDFAVCRVGGPGGWLIRLGQFLCGQGFADFEHAVVYVGVVDGVDSVVGAYPDGARVEPVASFIGPGNLWSSLELTDEARAAIVSEALTYVGTPYSVLDYFAIAAHRFHLPVPFLRRYIASSKHMICSELVDRCYKDAGVDLFPGEWDGYVTPAQLAELVRR